MRSALLAVLVLLSGAVAAPAAGTLAPQNFRIVGNPTPDSDSGRSHVEPRTTHQKHEVQNFRIVGNPTPDSE